MKNRRPGRSRKASPGCIRLFALVFLLAGIGGICYFISSILKEHEVGNKWASVPCTILGGEIISSSSSDGTSYRADFHIRYEYNGTTYEDHTLRRMNISGSRRGANKKLAEYPAGSTQTCWVNPENPAEAVLEYGAGPLWLFMLIPIAFCGVAIAIFVAAGKAAKRQFGKEIGGVECFPELPGRKAGRELPISLKPRQTSAAKLIGSFIFATIWNIITWIILGNMDGDLVGKIIMGIFALLGVAIAILFIYTLIYAVTVGDAAVEISSEPLAPGEQTRFVVAHKRRLNLDRAKVSLVCKEIVRYRQGTRTVTKEEAVLEHPCLDLLAGDLMNMNRIRLEGQTTIPPDAMHSFKASNNQVMWGLQVCLEIPGKPDVNEFYALRVGPRHL